MSTPAPSPPLCRPCRASPADSNEHLFQSAIGGAPEVPGILCVDCNSEFGRTVDAPLARELAGVRMLLAIEGDRDQTASVDGVGRDGTRIRLRPGVLPESAPMAPKVTRVGDTVQIAAYNIDQARRVAESLQAKAPGQTLTVTDVKVQKTFPTVTFDILNVTESVFARAAVKTALVLLARTNLDFGHPMASAWRYVTDGVSSDGAVAAGWSTSIAPWEDAALGPVPHRVTVRLDPEHQRILADVRYFGDLAVCIALHAPVEVACAFGVGADPFTQRIGLRLDEIGEIATPDASDRASVECGLLRALDRIKTAAEQPGMRALSKRIVTTAIKRALGSASEGPFTADEVHRIAEHANEELAFILRRANAAEDAPNLKADFQAAVDALRERGG